MVYAAIIAKVVQGVLFTSLVIGQLVRFSLEGQGGGVLVSDIAVVLFLLVSICFPWQATTRLSLVLIAPFLIWSVFILIFRSAELELTQVRIALSYWVRLASIVLLLPATLSIVKGGSLSGYAKKSFISMYISLLVLGFFQFIYFPNLEFLQGGWDPHIQRMTSTWLDPNFFGAFLAMCLPAVVVWIRSGLIMRGTIFTLACIALLFTKSRSTFVATLIAAGVCASIWLLSSSLSYKWRKVLVPGVVAAVLVMIVGVIALQERATQLFTYDPTVAIRLEAYQVVWRRLVEPNIFFGVGYNAYQFAAQKAGLISDFSIHSRGGSDSSILTLLVTTGVLGTIFFLLPMLLGVVWNRSLVFTWATVFLLVHSQFTNSLLYPHLLIPYILLAALTLR